MMLTRVAGTTAVWLALANMLIIQLDPPAPFTASLRAVPSHEVLTVVRDVMGVLLQVTLDTLGIEGGMEAVRGSSSLALDICDMDNEQNPDIVQDFFSFVEKVRSPNPLWPRQGDLRNAGVLPFRHGLLSPPTAVL